MMFAHRLHAEMLALTSYLSPTPQERRARSLLVSYITNMVRERWPARYGRDDGAVVHTFGSVATGLELPEGDIDLVLEFPSNTELTTKDRKTRLFQLAALLRSPERSSLVRDVHVVARARVPIVKVQTVEDLGAQITYTLHSYKLIWPSGLLRTLRRIQHRYQHKTIKHRVSPSFAFIILIACSGNA